MLRPGTDIRCNDLLSYREPGSATFEGKWREPERRADMRRRELIGLIRGPAAAWPVMDVGIMDVRRCQAAAMLFIAAPTAAVEMCPCR